MIVCRAANSPGLLPPLRGRVGEGGKHMARRVRLTSRPTALRGVDLPRKGGGEE
jgi:hypothetical protein